MSAFVIFAIVLTVVYVIYYGVVISRDLYGKKDQQTTNQETFEVSNMEEEDVATEVNETGDGFTFSDKNEEEQLPLVEGHDITESIEENENVSEEMEEGVEIETEADKAIITVYSDMEQIQPEHSVELEKNEFRMALMGSNKDLSKLLKTKRDEF